MRARQIGRAGGGGTSCPIWTTGPAGGGGGIGGAMGGGGGIGGAMGGAINGSGAGGVFAGIGRNMWLVN